MRGSNQSKPVYQCPNMAITRGILKAPQQNSSTKTQIKTWRIDISHIINIVDL